MLGTTICQTYCNRTHELLYGKVTANDIENESNKIGECAFEERERERERERENIVCLFTNHSSNATSFCLNRKLLV